MQNFMHDLLSVYEVRSGKAVHIGITDFELPGYKRFFCVAKACWEIPNP